jgi:peptide/nickel transport system permease protein
MTITEIAPETASPAAPTKARRLAVPPGVAAGAGIILVILVCSFVIPAVSQYSTSGLVADPLSAPSWQHLFGTDDLGRDVFTRAFAAAKVDILIALTGAGVAMAIGTTIGVVSGMSRLRWVDTLLMRLADSVIAFPGVVLILALVLVIGPTTRVGPIPPGAPAILLAIFLTNWAVFARLARSQTLVVRGSDYVHAAEILGYSSRRIIFRHVLPNIIGTCVAYSITNCVQIIIAISSLPFLGAGVEPPAPEWGNMMYEGRIYLGTAWWTVLFPGLLLAVTGIALALAAEGITTRVAVGRSD